MKEVVIISGKGGTGKTTVTGAFAALAKTKILADCDVSAANLHLLLRAQVNEKFTYNGSELAHIDESKCTGCGKCMASCRFAAINVENNAYRVDPLSCEGCGVCAYVCPVGAITLAPRLSGWIYVSHTDYGILVHGELAPGEEVTGKLVTQVKMRARALGKNMEAKILFVDSAPGIGCAVIASLAGAHVAVVVTEPSLSALHDLQRVVDLAHHFRARIFLIINKADLAPDVTEEISQFAGAKGIPILGHIPYDEDVVRSQLIARPIVEISEGPAAQALFAIWEKLYAEIEKK